MWTYTQRLHQTFCHRIFTIPASLWTISPPLFYLAFGLGNTRHAWVHQFWEMWFQRSTFNYIHHNVASMPWSIMFFTTLFIWPWWGLFFLPRSTTHGWAVSIHSHTCRSLTVTPSAYPRFGVCWAILQHMCLVTRYLADRTSISP